MIVFMGVFLVLLIFAIVLTTPGPREEEAAKPDPYEGINLPIADAAEAGEPSPNTTITIPLEWGSDPEQGAGRIAERYDAITRRVNPLEKVGTSKPTVTVAADRQQRYGMLYAVFSSGVKRGFHSYRLACIRAADSNQVVYLSIELPTRRLLGSLDALEPLVARLRVLQEGDGLVYHLNTNGQMTFDAMDKLMARAKWAIEKAPDAILRIDAPDDITVQQFVSLYGAAIQGGFKHFTLGSIGVVEIPDVSGIEAEAAKTKTMEEGTEDP